MEKFEKTFNDIKKGVKNGVTVISKKSVELADKTKARVEISSLNSKIDKLYCEIGKLLCDLKDDKISAEEVDSKLETAYLSICEYKDKIASLKEKVYSTTTQCPECDHKNLKDAKFCSNCGLRFDADDEIEE